MNWQRLKKFICAGKKNQNKQPDLISIVPETDSDTHPVSEKMVIPIRMVGARVSDLAKRNASLETAHESQELKFGNKLRENLYRFSDSYFCFSFCWYARKIFKFFLILLLILLFIEGIIAIWLWQMPSEQFQRFTSCLDVGTVSSLKERIAYYFACFLGALGG